MEDRLFAFGPFILDVESRRLFRDGQIIPLAPKAFDTLLVLVENRGRLMEKSELLRLIWPDTFVEEINLTVHVSALRKAIGESRDEQQYIETIPKRGYRFIAPVSKSTSESNGDAESNGSARGDAFEAGNESAASLPPASVSSAISSRWKSVTWSLGIAAGLVIAVGALIYFLVAGRETPASTGRSIAVLPFKILGADDEQYLSVGLADAVITKLSNLDQITVRPTFAVLKYEDLARDPLEAGRELGVDTLLSGVVQKSGSSIRVTVQLVRINDGASLWAGKFEENFNDIFEVQDAISQRVARSLIPQISGREREALARHSTQNSEAYQHFLRGVYCVNKGTPESYRKGIEYFERALSLDPDFAAAQAWIADTYTTMGFIGLMPPEEAMPSARAALTKALQLDGSNADALTAEAFIRMHYDHDWEGADRGFARALESNPNSLAARRWRAWGLLLMDRAEESRAEMKRAYEIDPATPSSNLTWGLYLTYTRQYDQSIEHHRNLIEMEPQLAMARFQLAITYSLTGLHEEAIAEHQRALKISGARIDFLAYAYAAAGKKTEARAIFARLNERAKQHYVSPYTLARIHAALGEKDPAFEMLERALRERDQKIFWLKIDPTFDALRRDARFADIMRKMNLPA